MGALRRPGGGNAGIRAGLRPPAAPPPPAPRPRSGGGVSRKGSRGRPPPRGTRRRAVERCRRRGEARPDLRHLRARSCFCGHRAGRGAPLPTGRASLHGQTSGIESRQGDGAGSRRLARSGGPAGQAERDVGPRLAEGALAPPARNAVHAIYRAPHLCRGVQLCGRLCYLASRSPRRFQPWRHPPRCLGNRRWLRILARR